jgi:outer membrane protein assembly factor BamB
MGLLMYGVPAVLTGVVLWMLATRGAATPTGRVGIAAISLLTWGYFTLLRVDGISATLVPQRSFRWTATAEDMFLAEQGELARDNKGEDSGVVTEAASITPIELVATAADWPEFRGALRDGIVRGVQIHSDWTAHPPKEVWRRRVGPGWSSFTVIGERVFTQEQRGEAEVVLCFDLVTGQEIWVHQDHARFWEVVAGAGPRATPTFSNGKLYSLGGSGKLNCLDAATGEAIWSRDIAADANTKPPLWGFSSSPLLVQDIVCVFAGGKENRGVLAYDGATGDVKWSGGKGVGSYSSPHLVKIDFALQVVMVSDYGVEAFDPATGKLLWEHNWFLRGVFRVCQPQIVGERQILVGTGMGNGTRQVTVSKAGDEWNVAEGWTTKDLKPYFNDAVQFEDHLYGFDGDILVCLDLATGKKKWKKGRYGHGQVLLAEEQGLLIVISDTGEAILVEASPQGLVERGRFQALTGKTWNHPVLTAGGKLLVRNGEEMACFDLKSDGPPAQAATNELPRLWIRRGDGLLL